METKEQKGSCSMCNNIGMVEMTLPVPLLPGELAERYEERCLHSHQPSETKRKRQRHPQTDFPTNLRDSMFPGHTATLKIIKILTNKEVSEMRRKKPEKGHDIDEKEADDLINKRLFGDDYEQRYNELLKSAQNPQKKRKWELKRQERGRINTESRIKKLTCSFYIWNNQVCLIKRTKISSIVCNGCTDHRKKSKWQIHLFLEHIEPTRPNKVATSQRGAPPYNPNRII